MREQIDALERLRDELKTASVLRKMAIAEEATGHMFELMHEVVQRVEKIEAQLTEKK